MPIVLFFSSRQISAHPIRNFRANPSTPGRFDNIVDCGRFREVVDYVVELWLMMRMQCGSVMYPPPLHISAHEA